MPTGLLFSHINKLVIFLLFIIFKASPTSISLLPVVGFLVMRFTALRLKRLLDTKLMGNLFKVIFAYKSNKDNFLEFE